MGHQPRLGHDRPYRTVGLILSVLGAELGSPPFRRLVAPGLSFQKRPTSLETEFYNSRYSQKCDLYWQI
jgi:hypothetical protein